MNVKAVKSVDNIGVYLSAYVTDTEVTDESSEYDVEAEVDGRRKRYVKGARMNLYPAGMWIYRHSRKVSKPVEQWVSCEERKEALVGATLTYRREYEDEDGFH